MEIKCTPTGLERAAFTKAIKCLLFNYSLSPLPTSHITSGLYSLELLGSISTERAAPGTVFFVQSIHKILNVIEEKSSN